jgi:hypothetical protein
MPNLPPPEQDGHMATSKDPARSGRMVAWVAFVFGSVMSVAGNVLHTWLVPPRPEGAPADWTPPEDWTPSLASQIGSAVWPSALLLSVEVLSRIQWPDTRLWRVARYGGVGTVGVGSAIISYGHLHGVLTAWNYGDLGAAVGPIVLDGLMVVSGFALLADGHGPARTEAGQADRTEDDQAEADRTVRVFAEVLRTGGPDQADRPAQADRTEIPPPDRAELEAGPDPLAEVIRLASDPDRPGPARNGGPDPLLADVVRWAAEWAADPDRTGAPSQRAMRAEFGIGAERARKLAEQMAAIQ